MNSIRWLKENKTWVFSGIGVAIISSVVWLFFVYRQESNTGQQQIGTINIQAGRDVVVVRSEPEKKVDYIDEFITGSEWNMLAPKGKTFKVKVLKNNLKVITFQMPLGTLDIPIERIKMISLTDKVIKIF
ncbi:MAG: hypothetical protein IID16_09935 [Candidatus Marinimicrobia bacterium]|nr:hypothetical protein [Candidatus Neomarinimicrobiota bacterium]